MTIWLVYFIVACVCVCVRHFNTVCLEWILVVFLVWVWCQVSYYIILHHTSAFPRLSQSSPVLLAFRSGSHGLPFWTMVNEPQVSSLQTQCVPRRLPLGGALSQLPSLFIFIFHCQFLSHLFILCLFGSLHVFVDEALYLPFPGVVILGACQ